MTNLKLLKHPIIVALFPVLGFVGYQVLWHLAWDKTYATSCDNAAIKELQNNDISTLSFGVPPHSTAKHYWYGMRAGGTLKVGPIDEGGLQVSYTCEDFFLFPDMRSDVKAYIPRLPKH